MDFSNLIPTAEQTIKFDWLSFVYIGIVLICFLLNFKNGFFKSLKNLIVVLGSLFIAAILAPKVANLVVNMGWFKESVQPTINDWASKMFGDLLNPIVLSPDKLDTQIPALLGEMKIPEIFNPMIIKFVDPLVTEEINAMAIVSQALTNMILIAVAFIILLVLVTIILKIVFGLIIKLFSLPGLNIIDHLLGGVLGIVIACTICVLISFVINLSAVNEGVRTYLTDLMYLEDDSVYTISKGLFKTDAIGYLLSLFAK